MKLAAVNPRLDIDVDNFFNKDVREYHIKKLFRSSE